MMPKAEFSLQHKCTLVSIDDVGASPTSSWGYKECVAEYQQAYREGDEVYSYDSFDEWWDQGMGSEGYMLLRNSIIVEQLVRKMN